VFFQPVAVAIDCNGSAVIHQTFDDCGCSLRMGAPTITKKQRDMLALLGLENPPRVLKN